MILVLDNYDSFTYNLVQRMGEIDPTLDMRVVRNDKISIEQIRRLKPERILISPGPCSPSQAGISVQVVEQLMGEFPILGVCLGHQAIGQALGVRGGGNSLDNTLRIVRLVPTKWVLLDIQIQGVERGFGHGTMNMFAEDGTLLATASQSVIARMWKEAK